MHFRCNIGLNCRKKVYILHKVLVLRNCALCKRLLELGDEKEVDEKKKKKHKDKKGLVEKRRKRKRRRRRRRRAGLTTTDDDEDEEDSEVHKPFNKLDVLICALLCEY